MMNFSPMPDVAGLDPSNRNKKNKGGKTNIIDLQFSSLTMLVVTQGLWNYLT